MITLLLLAGLSLEPIKRCNKAPLLWPMPWRGSPLGAIHALSLPLNSRRVSSKAWRIKEIQSLCRQTIACRGSEGMKLIASDLDTSPEAYAFLLGDRTDPTAGLYMPIRVRWLPDGLWTRTQGVWRWLNMVWTQPCSQRQLSNWWEIGRLFGGQLPRTPHPKSGLNLVAFGTVAQWRNCLQPANCLKAPLTAYHTLWRS